MLSRQIARQALRSSKRVVSSLAAPRFHNHSLQTTFTLPHSRAAPFSTLYRLRATTPMAAETDVQAEAFQNSTGITPESLTETLKNSSTLNATHVDIQDISGGCGASFAALIVSDAFKGKSALQRHRLVNGLLKEEIKAIHAWTPKCVTNEQWEAEKAKSGQ